MRIELKTPILVRGFIKYETLTFIELRKPMAGDLKGMDFSCPTKIVENCFKIVSKMSGVKEKDLETIALDDWNKITEVLNYLMGMRK